MYPLTFTVIEIAPQDGYTIMRVQVGSSDVQVVTTSDVVNMAVTNEVAALNTVGEPLTFGA